MKRKPSNVVSSGSAESPGTPLSTRLLAHISDLSKQQRLIAEYLLDNQQEVAFLSVPQLAERSGASEATVVRLCQRIGFSGFSDMKMAVVDSLREDLHSSSAHDEGALKSAEEVNILEAVAELEHHNIRTTLQNIDLKAFQGAATLLFEADHIFTFGLGISAHLAELASYLFTEHGLRANSISTHFTSPREQLVTMRESDVLFVFSFPPYSRQTLEVLEEAKAQGMKTVAITDKLSAPAVPVASQPLVVSSHGMTFTNATSSTNVLLNALVVEIASRHRSDAVDALSSINRILRDRSYLIGDD